VLGVHQRADLCGRVGRLADPDALGPRGEPGNQIGVDGPFGQNPGAGRAPFAVEGEHPEQGAVGGPVQVGVGEDQARRLAAQLHGQALQVRRRGRHDGNAGAGLAGEGDAGHVRVRDKRGARHLADAVHQVEHAVGQAGFGHDLR
jgi:hypothetical protein